MMADETTTLPRDEFSIAVRKLAGDDGAVRKQSIVELADDYGNLTTWIVTSYRHDGQDTILLQRQTPTASDRLVLPPAVTAAIARQRDGAVKVNRRKGAAAAVATRRAKGIAPFARKAGA